jgi:hypothetical protein
MSTTSSDSLSRLSVLLDGLAATTVQEPADVGGPPVHRPRPAATGPAWTVPPGPLAPAASPLGETLRRRRSRRVFDGGDVDLATVLDVLSPGFAADVQDHPGEDPLEWTIAALRTTTHRGSLLSADPGTRTVRLAATLAPDSYADLTLQREFADAGAVISVGGNLEEAHRAHGAHGYRLLLTRAATAAYLTWLAAVEAGLQGSVFAGFLPAAVRRPLASDGTLRQQLVAVAIGWGNPVLPAP